MNRNNLISGSKLDSVLRQLIIIFLIVSSTIFIQTAKAEEMPDLVIEDITWDPVNPKTDDTVTFTVTYKNQGQLSAGNSFNLCLYIDGKRVDYKKVSDLSAGSSAKVTFTWTVSREISDGSHSVEACVDMTTNEGSSAAINEISESNNDLMKSIQVTGQYPDLVIEDIIWDPVNPKTDDLVIFTVTYKNQGQLNAGKSFNLCLYVDGKRVDYKKVNDLSTGSSAKETFTWTVNREISDGSHSVEACVDMSTNEGSSAAVNELSESNNDLTKSIQITGQHPDLVIEDITWEPVNPKTNDLVIFTVTYKNQGQLSAGKSFNLCLYVDGKRVDYKKVNDLPAGSSAKETFTWTVSREINDGSNSVEACVDMSTNEGSSAVINEISESNNDLTKSIQITGQHPDLVIEDITWEPVNPKTNDLVIFTVTYKNQGQLSAGNSFNLCLYVDGKRVDYKKVNDLSTGSSAKETFTWTVNREISDGSHSVRAYVDMLTNEGNSARINEISESNNDLMKSIQVTGQQPDLVIEDITWDPVNPKTDDTVTFTVTYKNQGQLSAGNSFNLCLYVDGKRVDYKKVNDLPAGSSAKETFTWTVNREISDGSHSVRAYVDMLTNEGNSARIYELSESNNNKEVDVSVEKVNSYAYLIVEVKARSKSVNLEDANIYLDGELEGKTDLDGRIMTEIAEGEEHILKVTKTDYDPEVQTFKVGYNTEKKEIKVYLTYAKIPISITVKDEQNHAVSNAEVFLDDEYIGITDIDGKISADTQKNVDSMLKVTKNGYYDENAIIHIGSHKSSYNVKLKIEDKTAPNIVIGTVQIDGDDDEIIEEGESLIIDYSVRDDSGIGKITCKLDGKVIDSYSTAGTYSTPISSLTTGDHIIQIEATDADLNAHKTSKEIPVSVFKRGPYVTFKTTKNSINVGENAKFTLDALNPIGNSNMAVQLIIETPSGVSVPGSSFARSGAGAYTASYEIEPGDDIKSMTIDIQGNEVGTQTIKAEVCYSFPDESESVVLRKELTLEVTDPKETGNVGSIVRGVSDISEEVPGFTGIIGLFGLLSVAFILRK